MTFFSKKNDQWYFVCIYIGNDTIVTAGPDEDLPRNEYPDGPGG